MTLDRLDSARDIQELLSIRSDLEQLERARADMNGLQPKLDLFDLGDAYQLVFEVPGIPQENLEVALQGRSVTIAGVRDEPSGERLVRERPLGPFQRTVELPAPVHEDAAHAHLRQGLLVITLPKA